MTICSDNRIRTDGVDVGRFGRAFRGAQGPVAVKQEGHRGRVPDPHLAPQVSHCYVPPP